MLLALLLIRVAENETEQTWHQLKQIMRPLMVAFHQAKHGVISQTSRLKPEQKSALDALKLKVPNRYLEVPRPLKQ